MSQLQISSIIFIAFFLISSEAIARKDRNNDTCGIIQGRPLINGYGPYDYTNPAHAPKLQLVL
mgnify:CR=1 FL=1